MDTLSGNDGSWAMAPMPAGEYMFSVAADGMFEYRSDPRIFSDGTHRLEWQLSTSSRLTISIVDSERKPYPFAYVWILNEEGDTLKGPCGADGHGRVEIVDVPDSRLLVVAAGRLDLPSTDVWLDASLSVDGVIELPYPYVAEYKLVKLAFSVPDAAGPGEGELIGKVETLSGNLLYTITLSIAEGGWRASRGSVSLALGDGVLTYPLPLEGVSLTFFSRDGERIWHRVVSHSDLLVSPDKPLVIDLR